MKKLFIVALPLLTLFACNKVNDVENQNTVVSFTAIVDNGDTKTTITESGDTFPMSWTGGEIVTLAPFTTYPNPEDGGTLSSTTTPRYTFTNSLSAGESAIFKSTDFTPGAFETGAKYLVLYQNNKTLYYYRATTAPEDVTITHIAARFQISDEQVYNPSNALGLQDNILPMWGYVQKGGGTGHEPGAVSMRSVASIVKLVVTNNSSSAKTIKKITMACASTATNTGVAGSFFTKWSADLLTSTTAASFYSGTAKKMITLNCTNPVTIPAGGSKVFSFVTGGEIKRFELIGDLTWTVYDTADNIIVTATNNNNTILRAGKVHTKTCIIPAE